MHVIEPGYKARSKEGAKKYAAEQAAAARGKKTSGDNNFLSMREMWAMKLEKKEDIIENLLPFAGAVLVVAAAKDGKTLFAVQTALAVCSGKPLFDNFVIKKPGPVLFIEQDDPNGAASIIRIIRASPVATPDLHFDVPEKAAYTFGPDFIDFLRSQIVAASYRLVVLDSYTSMRGVRTGNDFVKGEANDLRMLDELAKQVGCTILIIHHGSKSSAGAHWSSQAAGSYAMTMATEGLIHISRFPDLDDHAPERLVQIRGRSVEGNSFVLRFQKETLNYYYVLGGGASTYFPMLQKLRATFGNQQFGPKDLRNDTGMSEATAGRQIAALYRAGALVRHGKGSYTVKPESAL